jgi:hypothetical protein
LEIIRNGCSNLQLAKETLKRGTGGAGRIHSDATRPFARDPFFPVSRKCKLEILSSRVQAKKLVDKL